MSALASGRGLQNQEGSRSGIVMNIPSNQEDYPEEAKVARTTRIAKKTRGVTQKQRVTLTVKLLARRTNAR
ncbi:hypothetical protein NDU88_004718 [Pleurodeles waltl]|uniref:Uncharacterized protein n=1 Tax=Pleurodeles waltl TaxID=8319 RepID=A0AAV7QD32_PLEWA|nr:hypothetical protein NDU88_004718 [Pleurodeles waltl]